MNGPSSAEEPGQPREMGENPYANLAGGQESNPEHQSEAATDDDHPRTGLEWANKLGYVDRVNNPAAFDTDGPVTRQQFSDLAGSITMLRDDDPQVKELRRRRLAGEQGSN